GPAEIVVALVELAPVRRGKECAFVVGPPQVRPQREHRLAVAPGFRVECVAGGDEQRFAVAADPARRPDAAAAPARRPACHVFRVLQRDADDPPAILPAIAEMPAERYVERTVEDDQGAGLV